MNFCRNHLNDPNKPASYAAKCVVCGAEEACTGTCGSDDPRALCNLAQPATDSASDLAQLYSLLDVHWLSGTLLERVQQLLNERQQAIDSIHPMQQPRSGLVRDTQDLEEKLNAAVDAEYPLPDSPHASVIQRATDNRDAMWRGIKAARRLLAKQQLPSDAIVHPPLERLACVKCHSTKQASHDKCLECGGTEFKTWADMTASWKVPNPDSTTIVETPSIDTPEFWAIITNWVGARGTIKGDTARANLIAFINAYTAAVALKTGLATVWRDASKDLPHKATMVLVTDGDNYALAYQRYDLGETVWYDADDDSDSDVALDFAPTQWLAIPKPDATAKGGPNSPK